VSVLGTHLPSRVRSRIWIASAIRILERAGLTMSDCAAPPVAAAGAWQQSWA
jgi:hypothetical protein